MSDVAEEYLLCRLVGHSWRPEKQLHWKPSFGHGLFFICGSCGMERRDTINARGAVAARSYAYPDGYMMTMEDRPTRAEVRQQYIRRYL